MINTTQPSASGFGLQLSNADLGLNEATWATSTLHDETSHHAGPASIEDLDRGSTARLSTAPLSRDSAILSVEACPTNPSALERFQTGRCIGKGSSYEAHESVRNQCDSSTETEEFFLPAHNYDWEHQGPLSFLAICTDPGISWVIQRTGVQDFAKIAKDLAVNLVRRLKVDRLLLGRKCEEPTPEVAWQYCTAYFEHSFDVAFGLVNRADFERRLHAHFRDETFTSDDPAWYALRNTVYASGCRIFLARKAVSFADVQKEAWKYFQNALTVYPELLFTFTGVLAVRALAAMTFFTEGLGSPTLQYMLCANAARLAQSKGLHRKPARRWGVSEAETISQSWLFWAIYCYEKLMCLRSARPSAIFDEEISCQIPTTVEEGSTINIEIFTHSIHLSKIVSQVTRRLRSASAIEEPVESLRRTALELEGKFRSWREAMPAEMRPTDSLKMSYMPLDDKPVPLLQLHLAYYGGILALHTLFLTLWISRIFGMEQQLERVANQNQALSSPEAVADAARNIIIIASRMEVTAASTLWCTFAYPMMALTHLFIYILRFSHLRSVRSDLSLLDVATGHFGRLEFISESDFSFSFARELAALARKAVNKAGSCAIEPSASQGQTEQQQLDQGFLNELWDPSSLALDDWNILSSMLVDEVAEEGQVLFTI